MSMRFLLALIFALCAVAFAAPVPSGAVLAGGNVARDAALDEVSDVVRPGAIAYVTLGSYWLPHPRQTALRSDLGVHDGYAFRQRLGGYFSAPIQGTDFFLGFMWFGERLGWDSEDFLFWPYYGRYALIQSVQTAGATITSERWNSGIAGGIQYLNPEKVSRIHGDESDSLYGFAHVFTGPLALQGSFGDGGWKSARASLHFESKELNGGVSHGIATYLPNFDVVAYRDASDSIRVTYEQNLYGQMLYGEVTAFLTDYGFYSAALKYYPDPSRIASFDFTCYRDENGDFNFGGGLNVFMIRLAYNHAADYENLFHAKRVFVVELNLALGAKNGAFFSRNAAKAAPVESTTKVIHEKNSSYRGSKETTNSDGVKEITATGIRREKK